MIRTQMTFSPGPQPTYTNSRGDDPDWVTPPPVGFTTNEPRPVLVAKRSRAVWTNIPEPILWEGDNA